MSVASISSGETDAAAQATASSLIRSERMSRILLDEFRGGKLGRFTLELPEAGNE